MLAAVSAMAALTAVQSPGSSTNCDGLQSDIRKSCDGMSANLSTMECGAWQDLFCSTNGNEGTGTWTSCLEMLNDPCSCKYADYKGRLKGVTCHHNTNNHTTHIDQIDLSGARDDGTTSFGMEGKIPADFALRLPKLTLLDLKSNLITGIVHFDALSNFWHRRVVDDAFTGLIRVTEENWGAPEYSPFEPPGSDFYGPKGNGTWHEDDANFTAMEMALRESGKVEYAQTAAPQLVEEKIINLRLGAKTEQEALEEWEQGSQGLVGVREPLSEEEVHEMIKLRSNFQYVCYLCPVEVPTPVPTDPITKLTLPPTPAPERLDPADECLGGTCTFRLYFGAPCDYPDKECMATPPVAAGQGAAGGAGGRDMSDFNEHYAPFNISLTLNRTDDLGGRAWIQRSTPNTTDVKPGTNATDTDTGSGAGRRRLVDETERVVPVAPQHPPSGY